MATFGVIFNDGKCTPVSNSERGAKSYATRNGFDKIGQISGYYGICDNPHGANPVLGGDPAHPDDYDEEFFINVLSAWDGTLVDCGNAIYGEDGYCIEL